MKKHFILTPLALLTLMTGMAAEKQTAQVERVTIYTNGAQVTRTKNVQLTAGEQVITFTGMSSYMDVNSAQVKANGRLTVLGVSFRTAYPDSLSYARQLKQARQAVTDVEAQIQRVKDEQEVIAAQQELVKTNCSVAGRTVATPLANIRELNNYYSQEMLSLRQRSQALTQRLADLEQEKEQKTRTRDSVARLRPKAVTEIDVKVDAPQAARATFTIAYYVRNASWKPTYDVRSADVSQPLSLSYKAIVRQNTGEEWQAVPVTLSSANPNRSGVAPQLTTNWLDFPTEVVYRQRRDARVNAKVGSATQDRIQMAEPMFQAAIEEEEAESDVLEVNQQRATFGYEFAFQHPLTLPSSTQPTTIEVARYELPATYSYVAVPKMDQDAFLVADAVDWERLNLLQGEANVFFDNSFVGKSLLDPTQASDTLHFSLGRDTGINVKRTKVNEQSTRRFLGSNQEQTVTWRITLKNTRREAVSLIVRDQVPVSRNSDISVTVNELSGGQRNDQTGIVTWQLQLQPGEQRDLTLQYRVKYPKDRRLTIE